MEIMWLVDGDFGLTEIVAHICVDPRKSVTRNL
jgi:hypothetical protein